MKTEENPVITKTLKGQEEESRARFIYFFCALGDNRTSAAYSKNPIIRTVGQKDSEIKAIISSALSCGRHFLAGFILSVISKAEK